jgi:hypothetical protein
MNPVDPELHTAFLRMDGYAFIEFRALQRACIVAGHRSGTAYE